MKPKLICSPRVRGWRRSSIKRHVTKKRIARELRQACRLSPIREMGDHRRWWWTAISPWTETDAFFGEAKVRFDDVHGRLYSFDMLKLNPKEDSDE